MTDASPRWLIRPRPNPAARLRLFCFPYAGAGASVFHDWPSRLPGSVEIYAVQLPGRGTRFHEPPFRRVADLVEEATRALLPFLRMPFAFFGHSMGALAGFELARRLRRDHHLLPAHLFVSGREAPQSPEANRALHALPDREFAEELRALKGTPREVLENSEMWELVKPILRADLELCETYVYRAEPPLECAVTAFGGREDPRVRPPFLEAWREQTTASFKRWMMPGDHFFLNTARSQVLEALSRELETAGRPRVSPG
jgi:medium-chain acyl-[acyl-carrier-protein] hydrolase